jgi:hypothetical protein
VYRALLDSSLEAADPDAGHDGQFEEDLVIPQQPDSKGRGGDLVPVVQPALFAQWLSTIDGDTERPQFSALHTRIPHHPWIIGGDGVPYLVPSGPDRLLGLDNRVWVDGEGLTTTTRRRHLLMVRYTDTLIAALQQRLESLGIWEDTTVIVTADHGAAFTPGGKFRYWDETNSPEILGVPLFVHGPDFRAGAVVDTPAELVDIVPTIAGVAGIAIPWSTDGANLLALPKEPRIAHPYAIDATDEAGSSMRTIDVSDHLERLLALRPAADDDGGGDLEILQDGPKGDLIGRSVDEFEVGNPAGGVHQRFPESPSPDDEFAIDDAGRVPAYLFGRVDGLEPGTTIIVALDDRIAAAGTVFVGESGANQYALILPPIWLAEGKHRVRYFVMDETSERAPQLLPLEPR